MGAARCRQRALGAAYGAAPAWAWHYTLGRKIPLILGDGQLRDAWTQDHRESSGKLGAYSVWFTTSERVDPTSSAALSQQQAYGSNPEAFQLLIGGHWRIGVPIDHPQLLTYQQVLAAHPPSTVLGLYYRKLQRHGENRNQWRVSLQPVGLAGCRIEQLQGDQWIHHPMDELSLDPSAPGYGTNGSGFQIWPGAGSRPAHPLPSGLIGAPLDS